MSAKYRIHVHRSVGQTYVSISVPPELREQAVQDAKALLESIPESTFQGDGVAITTIPGFLPPDPRR